MHVPQQAAAPPSTAHMAASSQFPQASQQYPAALSQGHGQHYQQQYQHYSNANSHSGTSYTHLQGSSAPQPQASANSHAAAAADRNPHLTPGMAAFLKQVRSSALFPPGCAQYTETCVAAASSRDHMDHIHRELHTLYNRLHSENKLHSYNWSSLRPVAAPTATAAASPAPAAAAAARAQAAVRAAKQRHAPPPAPAPAPPSHPPTTTRASNRWGPPPAAQHHGGLRDTAALPTSLRDTAATAPLHPRPSQLGAPPARGSREATLPAWAAGSSGSAAAAAVRAPPTSSQGGGVMGGAKRARSAAESSGYIPLVTPPSAVVGAVRQVKPRSAKPTKAELRAAAKAEKVAKRAEKAAARKAAKAAKAALSPGKHAIASSDIAASRSQVSQKAAVASRAKRFKASHDALKRSAGSNAFSGAIVFNADADFGPDFDLDSAPAVQGLSQSLEKSYFRLNAPPNPDEVRPQAVLERAIEHVLAQCAAGKPYLWGSDQMKAIRQDCVVQHITNNFTVNMYESHARLALQHADISEFNQCLTQLLHLYAAGHDGNQCEFAAYRVLYAMYTQSDTAISRALQEMTPEQKESAAVQHACKVQLAESIGNYAGYIQLYATAPNLNSHIMDRCLHRVRNEALRVMARAFRPNLRLTYVQRVLGISDQRDAIMLIKHCGGVVKEDGDDPTFETKASVSSIKTVRAPEELVANPMV